MVMLQKIIIAFLSIEADITLKYAKILHFLHISSALMQNIKF